MKKKIPVFIFMMLIGAVGGFFVGNAIEEYDLSLVQVIYIVVSLIISCYLGVILHEGGHFIAGRMSGYEFVSYRIGSMVWIKENGKLRRKRYNIQGTGGQCIMMPPELDDPKEMRYVFYFLGGGLANIICATIAVIFTIVLSNFYFKVGMLVFAVVNIIMAVTNLLPINGTVPNDGYNILIMRGSEKKRHTLYNQLRVNGLLHKGLTVAEIPEKYYVFDDETDGLAKLLESSYYLSKNDYETTMRLLREAIEDKKLYDIYKLEAKCELLFCLIMTGAKKEEIEEIYDKELNDYITKSKNLQVSKRRLMYTYYLFFEKDKYAAEDEYDAAVAMKDTYPCAGEYKMEMELMEYVHSNL